MALFLYRSCLHRTVRSLCPWRVLRWCTWRSVGGSMCRCAVERSMLRPRRNVSCSRRASRVVQFEILIACSYVM